MSDHQIEANHKQFERRKTKNHYRHIFLQLEFVYGSLIVFLVYSMTVFMVFHKPIPSVVPAVLGYRCPEMFPVELSGCALSLARGSNMVTSGVGLGGSWAGSVLSLGGPKQKQSIKLRAILLILI